MKKSLIFFITSIFLSVFLIFPNQKAYSFEENWEITNFHSNIYINENGIVNITEIIEVNLENDPLRGIKRSIQYKGDYINNYGDKRSRKTPITFHSATNEKGESWTISSKREGNYHHIKMINPNNTQMRGSATFKLNYSIKNVFNFFETHDEFYWNVNGTEWAVPIKNISATTFLPKEFSKSEIETACFTGKQNETFENCSINITSPKTINFESTKNFEAFENMTIVLAIPPKTISPPSILNKILWNLKDYGILFLIPITIIIMTLLWRNSKKDDGTISNTIMPHYQPPKDLLPSETGVIIDNLLDSRDITATIIDFAIKGFLQIKEIEEKNFFKNQTDYELKLLKPYETNKEFEEIILKTLFPINKENEKILLSSLQNKFQKRYKKIEKSIKNQLVTDGYYYESPTKTRSKYLSVGGIIIFIGFILGEIIPFAFFSLLISGLTINIIGFKIAKRTRKGIENYYKLKGLYEYIKTAEKDRLKFQEEENIMFEKLLPYAVAFGLATKWAKTFEGVIKSPPNWYTPSDKFGSSSFTMYRFANNFNRFTKTSSSYFGKSASSKGAFGGSSGFGGRGFSGGGFGGGGGSGIR